jgi:hypothetical protein
MEEGTMNSIGQKPRGFWQTDDCEFHLRRAFGESGGGGGGRNRKQWAGATLSIWTWSGQSHVKGRHHEILRVLGREIYIVRLVWRAEVMSIQILIIR